MRGYQFIILVLCSDENHNSAHYPDEMNTEWCVQTPANRIVITSRNVSLVYKIPYILRDSCGSLSRRVSSPERCFLWDSKLLMKLIVKRQLSSEYVILTMT